MTGDQVAAVERHATEHRCPRHVPLLRACHYEHGEPCACREAVLAGQTAPTNVGIAGRMWGGA